MQVAANARAQMGHALAAQCHHRPGLRARLDLDDGVAVQDGVHGDAGTQRRLDHRDTHREVQVVAVANEDVVRLLVHLDVQVAGRAAPGTDLALGRQPHSHPIADTGRDLDGDLPARTHAAVAPTFVAGVGDDLAGTLAGRAGTRCQYLTEQ
ncbi:Uncharacterised protein [Mycobacteroides abscessus subsp. abscessus]|nr:Uncharacterised protein [Mycobacteroides abscessus subsp. abscessus]